MILSSFVLAGAPTDATAACAQGAVSRAGLFKSSLKAEGMILKVQ